MTDNEQKLIDVMIEMVLRATDDEVFCAKPKAEKAKWVTDKLRIMGFKTVPVGSSWAVLTLDDSQYDDIWNDWLRSRS